MTQLRCSSDGRVKIYNSVSARIGEIVTDEIQEKKIIESAAI